MSPVNPVNNVNPVTMQITLDIPESDLAHAWADATWNGKHPKPLADILLGIIEDAASKHRRLLRELARETHQSYDALHEQCLTSFRTTCH